MSAALRPDPAAGVVAINAPAQDAAVDPEALVADLGKAARAATAMLAKASPAAKVTALTTAAQALRDSVPVLLEANARDMAAGADKNLSKALMDRLMLNVARIDGMAESLDQIAAMTDPIGKVIAEWEQPNGLHIQRVKVPLGVIGVIYESRPNVTADAGALCLKAGNAAILRGGSESFHSSRAIVARLRQGLAAAGLPSAAIQLVPTIDRAAVGALLRASEFVDVIVPRGGRGLIERVRRDSRMPVLAHLDGICHVYVHEAADLAKARAITVNAKMRRTGICGAAETLLVDRTIATAALPALLGDLKAAGCTVRGDAAVRAVDASVEPATEADWGTEYLDAIISARVVDGVGAAIDHVERYGSHHTETIVTEDPVAAEAFMSGLDSAILMVNASTQFADGGEFGMGAEIGIATGKVHVRGPVGAEALTSYKYKVYGNGHIRP